MEALKNLKIAAHLLGISVPKLLQLVRDKQIQHIRIGRRILFSEQMLERFIQTHTVPIIEKAILVK